MTLQRLMAILLVLSGVLVAPQPGLADKSDAEEQLTDLVAMPLPPHGLDEHGYQFARGGYLTVQDARYLIERSQDVDADAIGEALDAASWRQGYTGTLVLLEDRSYRTSTPLAAVETTIHELVDDEGAELVQALMAGALPRDAEVLDPAVEGALTYRIVTSQDDRLVSVVRLDRFLFEIVSADAARTPNSAQHAELVRSTLGRAQLVIDIGGAGLSQRIVPLKDSRLIPLAIETEDLLVHTYYRLLDGEIIPVAGELDPPELFDLAAGVETIVISRQSAELASQNWLTAGVIVLDFVNEANASAFAEESVTDNPLDTFAVEESRAKATPTTEGVRIESISGASPVGGRYAGYRVTVQDGETVAQLTIRVLGNVRLDQESVERWALAQHDCLAGGPCQPVMLTDLLATPDPATPVAGGLELGEYQSPVAAWSLAFDPDTWSVEEAFAEGGYDYLYLRSERVDATFETIVDQHGDPEQCILSELDRLQDLEEGAVITLGSDDPDEPPGGLEPGHGWVVYTVEPLEESRANGEYTLRIDCYTVMEGTTSLIVQVRAPRDAWGDVSDQGDEIRSCLEIDGLPDNGTADVLITMVQTQRRVFMDNRNPWIIADRNEIGPRAWPS